MSILKNFLSKQQPSSIIRGKDIPVVGWYHKYLNYDKVYNKEKGYYEVVTKSGTSGLDKQLADEAKEKPISQPFVIEQDSTKLSNNDFIIDNHEIKLKEFK